MYPSTDNIKDLIDYISRIRSINYRFMVENIDNDFKVTRLIIGGPKANWESYHYPDVFFRAGEEAGSRVDSWLSAGAIYTEKFPKENFFILPINSFVNCTRYPSHSQGGLFTLSRTFTMYSGSFSQAVPSRNDEFASADAPFFFALWEAERHLLYDIPEESLSYASHTPDAGIYVYLEHKDAWIEKIHFSLTSLDRQMEGELLMGATLKVVGSGIEE